MITKHDVKQTMEINGETTEDYQTMYTEHDGSTDEETTVQYESVEDFYDAKPELRPKTYDNQDVPPPSED